MTKADIEHYKASWVAAVKRSLKIGFDAIEIHNAQYASSDIRQHWAKLINLTAAIFSIRFFHL